MSRGWRSEWRSIGGNSFVLLLLAALAVWAALSQSSEWLWPAAGGTRLFAAILVVLVYAGWCLSVAWRRQRVAAARADSIDSVDYEVVYASQTGFAEALAQRTAQSLRDADLRVSVVALGEADVDNWARLRGVLFVVSTYGEGDAPDMAARFVRRYLATTQDLRHLHYGLLALGDRAYQQFCGFGRQLDNWLQRQAAHALFDRIEVDNADAAALRHWQHQLGVIGGRTDEADWTSPRYGRWTLSQRRRINPGSVGGACFHLLLTPQQPADADWQAGDVAEVGPRHAHDEVSALIQRLHLGDVRLPAESDETLHAYLARRQWPDDAQLRLPPEQWLAQLKPLPHREYSIASLPSDGQLELLVRQWRRADGRLGLGAGWLTEHAALGETIELRVRRNVNFHIPDDARPLILIGNGTGIAGLRALLKARIAAGHWRNWLLFGERQRAQDFLFGDEIAHWQQLGQLTRVDLAFSRDQAQRLYVQHRLAQAAPMLREWVADGASIYVCGSLDGMAPGVDAALQSALGTTVLAGLLEQGRYRRDVY